MKLSKQAAHLVENGTLELPNPDALEEFIALALTRPSEAAFWDDSLYVTHTLAFHTPAWNLTDEYISGQADYRAAVAELEPYGGEAATIGHWTYSTFECVKVPMLTKGGKITPAALKLFELAERQRTDGYLDEDIYSDLVEEVEARGIDNALDEYARGDRAGIEDGEPVELTDDQRSEIARAYREEWGGYHEPGYVDYDEFVKLADEVLGLVPETEEAGA